MGVRSRRFVTATILVLSSPLAMVGRAGPAAAAPGFPLCGHLPHARWACRYNGQDGEADVAQDVAVSPGGSVVYVTGSSTSDLTGDDFATVAYMAASGRRLWLARYNGSDNLGDDVAGLVVAPDGSKVFVTGSSYGDGVNHMATVAYEAATGAQLWVALYPDGQAADVDVSPDGSVVYTTGWSSESPTQETTVAYDTTLGQQLWVSLYGAAVIDEGKLVRASSDGSKVFVTGISVGTSSDIATIAMDPADGHVLWSTVYDDPNEGEDSVYGLAVSPSGSTVVVTGTDWSPETSQDFVTIGYDGASGDQAWIAHYTSPNYNLDQANAVAIGPDGSSAFVTGETWSRQQVAYLTISYDLATGDLRWLSRFYDSYAVPSAIGVDPDGSRVYVSGRAGSSYQQATTIAFDAATGGRVWVVQTALQASEVVTSLAVNPNGTSVFVTGSTTPDGYQSYDFLTVAYPA
jgi:hypothetical protein